MPRSVCQVRIVRTGAATTVIAAIQVHAGEPVIMESGMYCLQSLASAPKARVRIMQSLFALARPLVRPVLQCLSRCCISGSDVNSFCCYGLVYLLDSWYLVFEKPNRSSFTFTFTPVTLDSLEQPWRPPRPCPTAGPGPGSCTRPTLGPGTSACCSWVGARCMRW